MKMKNLFLAFVLALSTAQTLTPSLAYSQVTCDLALKVASAATTRAELVEKLKKDKVPAVMAQQYGGDQIPVILMNAKTNQSMTEFLKNSIGTQVVHQPDWHNDHGLFRIAKIIADMDLPGHRRSGELHKTGISWVSLDSYLAYGGSSKRIEIAYALTEAEMMTSYLYSMMRRAAIVRVRFSFGNNNVDTNHPNFLQNGGENCFGFCQSSSIDYQITEMRSRFNQLNLGDINEVMGREDVKNWLTRVRNTLQKAPVADAQVLSNNLPIQVGIPESLAKVPAFANMTPQKKAETLNWLVGVDISVPYRDLIRDLGFQNSGNGFNGMRNKRATAVLVYDAQVSDGNFMAPTYQSPGIFSTWTNANTTPIK